MPVTEQAGTLPHCSADIGETRQKKNKEEGGFSASRWESRVRKDSELARSCNIQVP